MLRFVTISILAIITIAGGCGEKAGSRKSADVSDALHADVDSIQTISLTSTAFKNGELIPGKYTCDGEDVSPDLSWDTAPPETKSFAIICDDPDAPAGTWVHWVIYDIPPDARSLSEAVQTSPQLENTAVQGRNDFNRIGYGGPCPPPGKAHRYFFKLYALDKVTGLPPGKTKLELLKAMKGSVLAKGQLAGTYKR